jgi:hypothetical protein
MARANCFTATETVLGGNCTQVVMPGETDFATNADPSKRVRQRGGALMRSFT